MLTSSISYSRTLTYMFVLSLAVLTACQSTQQHTPETEAPLTTELIDFLEGSAAFEEQSNVSSEGSLAVQSLRLCNNNSVIALQRQSVTLNLSGRPFATRIGLNPVSSLGIGSGTYKLNIGVELRSGGEARIVVAKYNPSRTRDGIREIKGGRLTRSGTFSFDMNLQANDGVIFALAIYNGNAVDSGLSFLCDGNSEPASVTSITSAGKDYVEASSQSQWLDIRGTGFVRTPSVNLWIGGPAVELRPNDNPQTIRYISSNRILVLAEPINSGQHTFDVYNPNPGGGGTLITGLNRFTARSSIRGDDYDATIVSEGRDKNGYYSKQCTAFVAHRMIQDGKTYFEGKIKSQTLQNAMSWANNASKLDGTVLRYKRDVRVGDVAQWNQGPGRLALGHVAYVAAVHDNDTITVEDYNWKTLEGVPIYDERIISIWDVDNFLRFP